MQITTLAVYSKLAEADQIREAFGDRKMHIKVRAHQAAHHIASRTHDVIMNTAMTGDGKTLAGQLPCLLDGQYTMALFPTNELANDQLRASETSFPQWGLAARRVRQLSGAIIDELLEGNALQPRAEAIQQQLRSATLLLSNPDILHAIAQFHYQQYGRTPDHLVSKLPLLFTQITVDEAHLYSIAEMHALLTHLVLLREITNRRFRVVFLSATPDVTLLNLLRRAGLGDTTALIEPEKEGWYAHGDDPGEGWSVMLRRCDVTFVKHTCEEWIDHAIDDLILPWFAQHGSATRAAIIVNSVATALRTVDLLRNRLPNCIRVEPNTGLNGESTRKRSYEAEILVGTSTVDVGVDFRINLLIFESTSADTFLQRLGRLGRHAGYTDETGQQHVFTEFKAIALVPSFVYDRLAMAREHEPVPLVDGAVMPRNEFARRIGNGVFLNRTQFEQYPRDWGRFQPAKVITALSHKTIATTYAETRKRLSAQYFILSQASIKKTMDLWESYRQRGEELIVQEAQSFRGESPLNAGVIKPDEGELLSYDLLWLLENARLEWLTKDVAAASARRAGLIVSARWEKYHHFFFHWQGLFARREPVTIGLGQEASEWGAERHCQAQVLRGCRVNSNIHPFLSQLNEQLLKTELVATLIPDREPPETRRLLYLTANLPLYRYKAVDGLRTGTIAFGRSALLLDSLLKRRRLEGNTPLFC